MKLNFFIYFENNTKLRAVLFGFLILCVVLFFTDFLIKRHVYFEIERYYNFYSIYGFVMFSVIIFGSRILRFFLMRAEDYYGEKAVDAEEYAEEDIR